MASMMAFSVCLLLSGEIVAFEEKVNDEAEGVDVVILTDCGGFQYVDGALQQYVEHRRSSLDKVVLIVHSDSKVLHKVFDRPTDAIPQEFLSMCDQVYRADLNIFAFRDVCQSHDGVGLEQTFRLLHRVLQDILTNRYFSKTRDTHLVVAASPNVNNTTEDGSVILRSHLLDVPIPKNVGLHFYINGNIKHLTSNIGKPGRGITYEDGSHFNKALTLDSLLKSKDAQTYQGILLSRGIFAEAHDVRDMVVNPLLWSPLKTAFKDLCDGVLCPNDTFCSPLHGCSQYADLDHQTIEPPSNSLPSSFSTNHADLTPGNTLAADTTVHQLSITDTSSTRTMSLVDTVVATADVLQWQQDRPFVSHAIAGGKPVVLRNTVVAKWAATKKWSTLYLAGNMGLNTLPFVKCSNTHLTFDPDNRAPLKLNISIPYSVQNMTAQEFFKCIDPLVKECEYKGYYYFGPVPADLKSDVLPDKFLYHTERDYRANKQFMWISSKGMITHGHFDQDYNIFIQVVGEKRFTFWSPWQHDKLYVYPRVHPLWHKSRINFRHPDIGKFPRFKDSKSVQVLVGAGDVLYVPPYTWHYVETLSPSVSLSTWSHDYRVYDNMNAIYGHDHKFDLIASPKGMSLLSQVFHSSIVQVSVTF